MAWRKLRVADVNMMVSDTEYGIVARDAHLADTPFNGVTIIGSERVQHRLYLRLARPQAYASKFVNSRQALLYAEVYTVNAQDVVEGGSWPLEVWENRDGKVLSFRLGA